MKIFEEQEFTEEDFIKPEDFESSPVLEEEDTCHHGAKECNLCNTQEPMEWESELKAKLWELGHTAKDAQHIIDLVSSQIKQAEERERSNIVWEISKMRMDSYNLDFESGYNQAIGNIISNLRKQ